MPGRRTGQRRITFGHTWWGRAWVDALEGRAQLDPNRLPRGRTYARQGRAAEVTLAPGAITAPVQGSRAQPYQVTIEVRPFTDDEWARVIAVVASKIAHAAALLDGELDPAIDADAREAGVELLPDAGEIRPRCSCPDWADPCKHAAAVCYLVADELDADPYRLLLLRGRTRDQVEAAVRAARASGSGAGSGGEPEPDAAASATVRAADAWARWNSLAVKPTPPGRLPLPEGPGSPAPWPADPPPESGLDGAALHGLAADAALRAWAVLADGRSAMLHLRPVADVARRAAAVLDTDSPDATAALGRLAADAGIGHRALVRLARSWLVAGPGGIDVLDGPTWRPPPEALAAARQALIEAGVAGGKIRVDGNRVTGGGVQLRYGFDRRWYRLDKAADAWEVAGPAADDPADLL
ncbi:MAG: SWIM zinc finger family protein [Acidimicrobiales bacterium]